MGAAFVREALRSELGPAAEPALVSRKEAGSPCQVRSRGRLEARKAGELGFEPSSTTFRLSGSCTAFALQVLASQRRVRF